MRRCLAGDLSEAAALLAASDIRDQHGLCQRLIAQADAAHRYAKRFGRAHPKWGNGSLMSRVLAEEGRRCQNQSSAAFLAALSLVAHSLAQHKRAAQA